MGGVGTWPEAGTELTRELCAHRGRLCLIERSEDTRTVTATLASLLGCEPLRVGLVLTEDAPPRSAGAVRDRLAGRRLLIDLDVLFWRPWLALDPLALLRDLARREPPVIVEWPGRLVHARAVYSEVGRADHFEGALDDAVVLRPRMVTFPDEVPYKLKRWLR